MRLRGYPWFSGLTTVRRRPAAVGDQDMLVGLMDQGLVTLGFSLGVQSSEISDFGFLQHL